MSAGGVAPRLRHHAVGVERLRATTRAVDGAQPRPRAPSLVVQQRVGERDGGVAAAVVGVVVVRREVGADDPVARIKSQ